ncbi:hypothetical protein Mgra_00002863 [Meloidogyne graminicola]|uniref:Uncharacterized protein n=1 Tax=Meloidogyne graminicola TaxID=189291 RepID=A0A8S9ZWC9_9BILA|nr:hypothetical protein Mgra_00002863 [Meloidogyne graminicola]
MFWHFTKIEKTNISVILKFSKFFTFITRTLAITIIEKLDNGHKHIQHTKSSSIQLSNSSVYGFLDDGPAQYADTLQMLPIRRKLKKKNKIFIKIK